LGIISSIYFRRSQKLLPSGKKSLALSAYPVESAGDEAWGRSTESLRLLSRELLQGDGLEFLLPVATNVAGTKVVWNIQESYLWMGRR
jgi:hypothetical protein